MSDPAQPRSQLLSKMRGAFQQKTGGVPVQTSTAQTTPTPAVTPVPVEPPQQLVQEQSKSAQPKPVLLSTAQRLDALDTVLTDIEQSTPVESPQPQPGPQPETQPIEEAPVVTKAQPSTQTPPQVQPQQPIQARQQNMGMIAQATPTAVDQAVHQQQELRAAQSGLGGAKETLTGGGVDTAAVEAAATVQYIEQEPNPEISPEVADYLQHVKDHANGEPQELVVGEEQQQMPLATNYQKQAVVVLPITPEVEKEGARKRPLESVRWLVEWSRKLIKMFSGTIIYREIK